VRPSILLRGATSSHRHWLDTGPVAHRSALSSGSSSTVLFIELEVCSTHLNELPAEYCMAYLVAIRVIGRTSSSLSHAHHVEHPLPVKKMAKRPTEPDASQPPQKKPKVPAFRSSLPRPQNTSHEPRSSRSTSSSTVVTISQSEGGRRRGTGQYRNRQASTPQPTIETDIHVDSGEPVLVSEPSIDRDRAVDPRVSEPTVGRDNPVNPSKPVYVISTPKDDLNTAGRQNATATPASKAKRKRNNNTAVSNFYFI